MGIKEISSESQVHSVSLRHKERGEIGNGKLSFSTGIWTTVLLKNPLPMEFSAGESIDQLQAITDGGRVYTLWSCQLNDSAIYAEYLFEGDIAAPEFDQIIVRYSDISEWFLHWQNIEGSIGEQLTWTQNSKPLSVIVSTDEDQFKLTSEYVGTIDKQGEDRILHEHIEFCFKSTKGKFILADLRNKIHELSCLLSLLIAYPVTIASTVVRLENERDYPVHFLTFERPKRDLKDSGFWLKFFIQKPVIEERWQIVFDNYYRSKYRKLCWIRLAGLQRYEGFWEYKVLGYVSLLDSYVTISTEGKKKPEPCSKKILRFRNEITTAFPQLDEVDHSKLEEIASRVFSSKGVLNFFDKYQLVIGSIDPDITKIISFSEECFNLTKRIRNAIAHGDDPELSSSEFSKIGEIVGKITLLLTYLAFLDFGLTKDDFINALKKTFNPLHYVANLDNFHLDRVTEPDKFFSVTEKTFNELKKISELRTSLCFVRNASGKLDYSKKYTFMYKDSLKDKTGGRLKIENIFGVDENAVEYLGFGYFEYEENRLKVYNMWIINP
ncbi:HEPN domain-containing protein [Iodobacter sp. LRB]|uniref:ApeA N-terminal domain 1-containing protein n=1 Tax=Iodobacter sp. LRB TaxID=3127955 RepID=UPI00307F61EA